MRIEVRGVDKEYPSGGRTLKILEGVELDVESGETVAIVGPSGSGKTTLLGIMAGLDEPTRGRVRLDSTWLSDLTEDGRAGFRAAYTGFIFQTFQLLSSLTAIDNVQVPLELGTERLSGRDIRKRAEEMLERVGLAERAHHYPSQLSGGEQQRVGLARAFVTRPGILFADEPTGNLDRDTGRMVADLLHELNLERGTTMVLVTHDESLARESDRVLRMDGGRLRAFQE